jgi:diguanylate cyclase (GGDEF)-like protein
MRLLRRLNTDVLMAMMPAGAGAARRRTVALAAVPLFVALLSFLSLAALRAGVLTIWAANGVWLAGLLRCRPRYRAAVFTCGACGVMAGASLAGLPARQCIQLAIANGAELAAALLLSRTQVSLASFSSLPGIFRFAALAGAAPALVFVMLSALLLLPPATEPAAATLASLWLSHATGTACMFPLCAKRRPGRKDMAWPRVLVASLLLVSVCLGVFGQSSYPLLFAVPAPLLGMVIADGLETGLAGFLLIALTATLAAAAGTGPIRLVAGAAADRLLILQVFLAVCCAQVFVMAAALLQRREAEAALREAQEEMQDLARIDALTNLANRRAFDETLDREFRRAVRYGTPLALVLLDVDRFKFYNDRYGHQRGDECLRAIGQEVAAVARRPTDLAARYGGEELALILPDTDEEGAMVVAEKLRAGIEARKMPHEGNLPCGGVVTASLGVAVSPMDTEIICKEDLIRVADMLLYEAKRLGRNRVLSHRTRPQAPVPPSLPFEAQRADVVEAFRAGNQGLRSKFLDLLAERAARIAGAPIGLVSLVGRDEQVFVGRFGLAEEKAPRETAFCDHAIQGKETMVVPDPKRDPRFRDNALVTGDMHLGFYAGSPIRSSHAAHPLGAICVIDTKPRSGLPDDQRRRLDELAGIAASYIDRQLNARGA